MKIRSVRSVLLSCPLPEPLHLACHGGEKTVFKRDAMLIRVETEEGLVGYAPGEGSPKAHRAVANVIAPFLAGRVAADPDALRIRFQQTVGGNSDLIRYFCSVEVALYDLIGKDRGLPVSELLGGRVRDRIRLYGGADLCMTPERYAEEEAAIARLGLRACKLRPGLEPGEEIETVRQVRQTAGPDFDLMVDARAWWRLGNRGSPAGSVDQLAGRLAEHNVTWLEEPFPPEDHQAYRKLKELDLVPLAAGRHEPDEARYLDLILTGCVDYVQMDLVRQGGYPTGRRLFNEIAREGMRFAFHNRGTELELIAAAQLGVCWPEHVVEWLEYPFPLASGILKEPLTIDRGDLVVPRKPGLGVEIDESAIERYPWIPA